MAKIFLAGDFATSGEKQVAQELEKLPDHWIIICNKTLVANNGRSFEIDLIVIGNQCDPAPRKRVKVKLLGDWYDRDHEVRSLTSGSVA